MGGAATDATATATGGEVTCREQVLALALALAGAELLNTEESEEEKKDDAADERADVEDEEGTGVRAVCDGAPAAEEAEAGEGGRGDWEDCGESLRRVGEEVEGGSAACACAGSMSTPSCWIRSGKTEEWPICGDGGVEKYMLETNLCSVADWSDDMP